MEERDHIQEVEEMFEKLRPQDPDNPLYGPGFSYYGQRTSPYYHCPKCGHEEKVGGEKR
jgi:hypothetical protein